MIVRVMSGEPSRAVVDEATVLDELMVSAGSMSVGELDSALRSVGLGHAEDEHAWLKVDALRERSNIRGTEWLSGFEAMIAFAESSGWMSPDGAHVRAHLVRQTSA